jgi:hypothetical protein
MKVGKHARWVEKQRNNIGAKNERQGTPWAILLAGGEILLQSFD